MGRGTLQFTALANFSRAGKWSVCLCLWFFHSHLETHSKVTKQNTMEQNVPVRRVKTDHCDRDWDQEPKHFSSFKLSPLPLSSSSLSISSPLPSLFLSLRSARPPPSSPDIHFLSSSVDQLRLAQGPEQPSYKHLSSIRQLWVTQTPLVLIANFKERRENILIQFVSNVHPWSKSTHDT